MITLEELKSRLTYDKNTGQFISKIKNRVIGSLDGKGYMVLRIGKKKYQAHRIAWFYVYGELPKKGIDHINHNKSDNRIENLREACQAINTKNTSKYKNNKSGVMGVTWHKKDKRWQSSIRVDGKLIYLGGFKEFHEAVDARKNAEVLYGFHKNHGKDI